MGKVKRQYWDNYVFNLEYDVHGYQAMVYKALKEMNKSEKDKIQFNPTPWKIWKRHFKNLWTDGSTDAFTFSLENNYEDIDPLDLCELLEVIQNLKSKKAPGIDNINTELLKNAPLTSLL